MRSSELFVDFDTALRGLVDLEREKAQLHRREIGLLISLHRGAGQYVAGGAPGAERTHGLDSRGDTWVDGTDVAVAELAPAARLSLRAARRRIEDALTARSRFARTLDLLADAGGAMTQPKLSILLKETAVLTRAQCTTLQSAVLPRASSDNSAQWRRHVREEVVRVLGAPLAAKLREAREDERYVAISPDGMIAHLLGDLPLAQGQAFTVALDELARTASPGDKRTHEQRRADALLGCVLGPAALRREHEGDPSAPAWDEDGQFVVVESAESEEVGEVWELIRQLAAAVDITLPRPPRVTLEVTISAHLLAGSDRATAGTTGPVCATCGTIQSGTAQPGTIQSGTAQPGTIQSGTAQPGTRQSGCAAIVGLGPVDPDLARHLAKDARWRRIVTDPMTGLVLDVGTTRYRPPAPMRRRVVQRDGVCRYPGCVRAAVYTELDHVEEFDPGHTADANLIALCTFHHRIKHQTRWTPTLDEAGVVTWISPTGRRYQTFPINRQAPPRS